MPATAGWVKMPQSNRVAVSASLRTHAIWTDSVGYDPYAPEKAAVPEDDSLKDKAKELLTLARLTGTLSTHTPGACTKCNQGRPPPPCRV
ncbi:zinc knuckle domain-containing protein [Cyclospora cayetanensis]|uniref:Zinc knuckle domain-containing protein n=1 Tax=Cyclospora cayetanensis TaxID=88456 RepID=A0A1D3D0H6_9EIME|nr:zinc knuckle domain-containing protein [Cyclospora cayetanensis]